MKVTLDNIIETEVYILISYLLKNGSTFQSAKQEVNNLLLNVDANSDSSVAQFLQRSHDMRNR